MKNNDLTPIPLNDLARLLAVSPRTVRRMVDNGDFRAIRFGSTLAVPAESLPASLRRAHEEADDRPLLTVHDVAAWLGCSPRKVRALSADGVLHPISIGRSTRWRPSDIESLRDRGGDHGE
jgi:excisionase family DNA binding protein